MKQLPARNPIKGLTLMLGAAFAFSIMGALVKHSGATLPFSEIAFFRAFINFLLIAPLMLVRRISFVGKNRRVLLARSLAGFCALSLGFYVTVKLPLADASILTQLSVPFVALLSIFLAKERPDGEVLLCILLAFVGALCIIKPGLQVFNFAGLLGVLAGLSSALAIISIRELHQTEHSLTIVFNFCFVASLLSLLFFGTQFRMPRAEEWAWLVAMGAAGSVGQVLMTRSYVYGPAALISPFTYAGVIFSAIWGALFWSEFPDILSVLGGLLVIFSSIKLVRAGL